MNFACLLSKGKNNLTESLQALECFWIIWKYIKEEEEAFTY
jgi:hypothetical protein